jgi:hypothetical protein
LTRTKRFLFPERQKAFEAQQIELRQFVALTESTWPAIVV